MQAQTIDEVIGHLDTVIEDSRQQDDYTGCFAALYRAVTVEVRDRCAVGGYFDDDERMRQLDVVFANRYFNAYTKFRAGEKPSHCWRVSFKAAQRRRHLLIQHLLLGINAHIGLDLGVAAAEVGGSQLHGSFHDDFDRINALLAEMLDNVQKKINRLSPLMGLIDRWFRNSDEALGNFQIGIARDGAWQLAETLAVEGRDGWPLAIAARDRAVAAFGEKLVNPGWRLEVAIWLARLFEVREVDKVVDGLV
jgi:hypothetical protein